MKRGLGVVAAGALLPFVAFGDASQGNPELDYMLQCQGCHGADGRATPQAGIPTLIDLAPRFLATAEGRDYLVRVPGVAQAPLSHTALAGVLNWMLERFQSATPGEPFRPYTGEEVARALARGPIDVGVVRARLLANASD